MKMYEITYDDGYTFNHYRVYANSKAEARKKFRECGNPYKIIEIEEI